MGPDQHPIEKTNARLPAPERSQPGTRFARPVIRIALRNMTVSIGLDRANHLRYWAFLIIALALVIPQNKAACASDDRRSAEGTPILWRDPGDIESRDLFAGPGGVSLKPDLSRLTFRKEKEGGYSTKYRVTDGAGRNWIVKVGKEAQSEVAATRLLWAVGYFTDINVLAPTATISKKATVRNARFEARLPEIKRRGEWEWEHNPFTGTPELQGLKIMMLLVNNWDIKDSNNEILEVTNPETGAKELQYIVSDLGATLGKTGGVVSRTRNKPEDFEKTKFIDVVNNNFIQFHYSGKRKDLFDDITPRDARWIARLLTRLSDKQLGDAFRAANYDQQAIDEYVSTLRARINDLSKF